MTRVSRSEAELCKGLRGTRTPERSSEEYAIGGALDLLREGRTREAGTVLYLLGASLLRSAGIDPAGLDSPAGAGDDVEAFRG